MKDRFERLAALTRGAALVTLGAGAAAAGCTKTEPAAQPTVAAVGSAQADLSASGGDASDGDAGSFRPRHRFPIPNAMHGPDLALSRCRPIGRGHRRRTVTFLLRRATADDDDLDLAREHAKIVAPRRGAIAWTSFDRAAFQPEALATAAREWRERARQEHASLALFTRLASQLQVLGAPLDWSGAFARMVADEVRHTELCARFADLLEPGTPVEIDDTGLHLPILETSLLAHVRGTVLATFCIGETLSGRFFRRCLRAATVPLARQIVRAIVDDETFHGKLGWELLALLLRSEGDPTFPQERQALARGLRELFLHYRSLCGADPGEPWATSGEEAQGEPNFGTLTAKGYARSFFEGMRDDVVPGLVALGLPEAEGAWREALT